MRGGRVNGRAQARASKQASGCGASGVNGWLAGWLAWSKSKALDGWWEEGKQQAATNRNCCGGRVLGRYKVRSRMCRVSTHYDCCSPTAEGQSGSEEVATGDAAAVARYDTSDRASERASQQTLATWRRLELVNGNLACPLLIKLTLELIASILPMAIACTTPYAPSRQALQTSFCDRVCTAVCTRLPHLHDIVVLILRPAIHRFSVALSTVQLCYEVFLDTYGPLLPLMDT